MLINYEQIVDSEQVDSVLALQENEFSVFKWRFL